MARENQEREGEREGGEGEGAQEIPAQEEGQSFSGGVARDGVPQERGISRDSRDVGFNHS